MEVSIVYDGDCPVCRHVVSMARLRERMGTVALIDARREPVSDIQGRSLGHIDFDSGFVVVVDGVVHEGSEAAHVLAGLTQPKGLSFSIFRWLMRSERRSRLFYPVLARARQLLLRMMGVPLFRP